MLRLILAILLLLSSLLVLFRAPIHFLWLLAVVITNYPYIFAAASLIVFSFTLVIAKYRAVVLITSFIALFVYSVPILMACQQSRYVPKAIGNIFGLHMYKAQWQGCFSILKMFTGYGITPVTPTAVTYKTVGGQALMADVYPCTSANKSPLIIVVHGGSWQSGDNKQFIDFNSYFANRGYTVVAINYRLAPAYKSPAPMEDTRDAITFFTTHANEYNIDTGNIVLVGRSAGAQIALIAAYSQHNPNIKGVVDFYGPADMLWGGQVKTNKLMLNTTQVYNDYFGGVYSQVPQVFKQNSACEYVNAGTPPTLIIHGTTDAMVSHIHSEHLAAKLASNKVPYYFLSLPYATHGCDYSINSPGGQVSTYAVEQFLHAVTKQ